MASGYRGGLDLTRWFMSGLESAAASRKKKEQDEAVRQMMGSVSEAMQPREETTFPDLGASPAVAPQDMKLGAEGAARYFQPPAAPRTKTVEPGKREIADSILKAISESPQAGDMAGLAAKLFGGYIEPESSDSKVVPENASLYVPGEGFRSPTPGGAKTRKGSDFETFKDKRGDMWSVDKPGGTAARIQGLQGKADRNTSFLMDEKGQAVLIDEDSGQRIPLPLNLFGKEAYKLNNEQKSQSLDQYTTSLLKKWNDPNAGPNMSDEEISTMNTLVDIKENRGFMDFLAGAPGSNLPPPTPRPWQQPAAPPAVPPKDVGILDRFLKGAPEATLEAPKAAPRPRFRRRGDAPAPGPGESPATNPGTGASPGPKSTQKPGLTGTGDGSYKFSTGTNSYNISPKKGANPETVKEDMGNFKEAWSKGIPLNELFQFLEDNGYTINR